MSISGGSKTCERAPFFHPGSPRPEVAEWTALTSFQQHHRYHADLRECVFHANRQHRLRPRYFRQLTADPLIFVLGKVGSARRWGQSAATVAGVHRKGFNLGVTWYVCNDGEAIRLCLTSRVLPAARRGVHQVQTPLCASTSNSDGPLRGFTPSPDKRTGFG